MQHRRWAPAACSGAVHTVLAPLPVHYSFRIASSALDFTVQSSSACCSPRSRLPRQHTLASTGPAEQRSRLLLRLNVCVLVFLGPYAVLAPAGAAAHLFGDTRAGKIASLMDMSPPTGGSPLPAYQMLGAWWVAVGAVSALGLRDPLKFSPVFLIQAGYKLVFLFSVIMPLVLKGRWTALPLVPTIFFEGFLIPLFALTPWGYLLGSKAASAGTNGEKLHAAKAE